MEAKRYRKWLVQGGAPLMAVAVVIVAVLAVDRVARERLQGHDRYTVAFADIECPSPPGTERSDFLVEVQYLGAFPERLRLLDEGLADRLAAGFTRHPWVEEVERVRVSRSVQADLRFRTPMLTVADRAVDGAGVLLPQAASSKGLPVLTSAVSPPKGPAGSPWGDAEVEGAAKTAAFLRPDQERLPLTTFHWDKGDLVLSGPRHTDIRWGRPPGAEHPGEVQAERKRQRLLGLASGRDVDLTRP